MESPRCPLDRRFGGPQYRSAHYGEEKNLAFAGNQTPVVQPVACLYTDWAIPAPLLGIGGFVNAAYWYQYQFIFSLELKQLPSLTAYNS
jgi:hypothetical protein